MALRELTPDGPAFPKASTQPAQGTFTKVMGVDAFLGVFQHGNSPSPALVSMGCCRGRHNLSLISMCEIISSSKQSPPCYNTISKY